MSAPTHGAGLAPAVAVVGGGEWGTALACAASRAGCRTSLLTGDPEVAREIVARQRNSRSLPGVELPPIAASTDPRAALSGAQFVLFAVPAQQTAATSARLAPHIASNAIAVACAKGIDRASGLLPAELLDRNLGRADPGALRSAALSGPSFATDVGRGLPTAVTVAAGELEIAARLAETLSSRNFRCYASDDLAGVGLGGALKNVLAIAVGATRGMELGASAEAALVARGFRELTRIAAAAEARPETLAGLSGLGDLVLTCSGPQSRNFAWGLALGRGEEVAGMKLAEGVHTAAMARDLAARLGVHAPVISAVADVVAGALPIRDAVARLLDRPLRTETE